jgi:hypothetical protein
MMKKDEEAKQQYEAKQQQDKDEEANAIQTKKED